MLQRFFRKITTLFYKPILEKYLQKPRLYKYKQIQLTILPGVFHPGVFFSTKFLLNYLNNINFNDKSIVEVGSGNGLIAFNIALNARKVIALELSKIAIKGLQLNYQNNVKIIPNHVLQIIESNLFENLSKEAYNYIIVNPPYYPNTIKNEAELAWNCGPNFEYFNHFFSQVGSYMQLNSKIIMVLSNQCNINKINEIANRNGFKMDLKVQKNMFIEINYIFEITLLQS